SPISNLLISNLLISNLLISMSTCLIICGALAREVLALKERHNWKVDVVAVPATFHMIPARIAPAVEKRIVALRDRYKRLVVVYGDCGTGGALDAMLDRLGVERIAGPHCYEWYGGGLFQQLLDEEPGSYFVTDFMVRQFRTLILKSMGLDRFPQLKDDYFGNYRRLVYLVQKPDPALVEEAKAAASYLGLPLEIRATGYNFLEARLLELLQPESKLILAHALK
ncbi:MAG: DUF1638 domain-containing protein, partial [Caldilinea sp.]